MGLKLDRLRFGLERPDLVLRRLRGDRSSEIPPDEIARHIRDVKTVVEAGALDGTDTVRLRQAFPQATVHAFEPVPDAYDAVCERVQGDDGVRTYQMALSDTSGMQQMYVSSGDDGAHRPDSSSLLEPTGHLSAMPQVRFEKAIQVQTATLDDWAREHGVDTIDLLWLDMQGMELGVLRAAPAVVATARGVMVEVSRQELYGGMPLYDEVVAWMQDHGFRLKIDRVSRVFGNAFFIRESH